MDREVVRHDPGEFGEFDRAKRPKRFPAVLTRDEVRQVWAHLKGTCGVMALWLYGTGLQLMERAICRVKTSTSHGERSRP